MDSARFEARISTDTVVRIYAWAVALALGGWALTQSVRILTGHGSQKGMVPLFDLNGEANVPAWVATVLLFGASGVAALNATAERARRDHIWRAWAVLSAGLVYLSLDEAASLHEGLSHALHAAHTDVASYPVLQFVLMATLATAGAAVCLPLLTRVPPDTRRGLLLAGAVYVFGAAGADVLGGLWIDGRPSERKSDLTYTLLTTLEEGCELAGMLLFTKVAGGHLERRHGRLGIALARPE